VVAGNPIRERGLEATEGTGGPERGGGGSLVSEYCAPGISLQMIYLQSGNGKLRRRSSRARLGNLRRR
jgi:hypothetical protein